MEVKMAKLEDMVKEMSLRIDAQENKVIETNVDNCNEDVTIGDMEDIQTVENLETPDGFQCHTCDFKSSWQNGLAIHVRRKHRDLPQLDGTCDEDECYDNTKHYWKTGWLGCAYQTYLDAIKIVDDSSFEKEVKKVEKDAIIAARKLAFRDNFRYYPPWC